MGTQKKHNYMDQEKKLILVTWDFSEIAEKAVKHAIRISKIVENDIALFHVTKYEKDIPDLEKKLQEETARLEETYGHKISFILRQGTIFGEISDFATNQDNRVNFVIMGTHGMKGAQKLFGSWALKVIAGSAAPFIVVQDDPPEKERYTDIVFPIDFKSENKEKLQWAIYLGKYFNSRIHLYKTPIHEKNLQKKVNVNLNFAIRFLIQNNIEYDIHTGTSTKNFTKEILTFSKSIDADLILITTTKHLTFVDYVFGAKEQYLISNTEGIPIMCVNPKSNFAKVAQFMYG